MVVICQHHCRNCGDVVCGNCSKNKFLIPNQSSKPVRVCNACYEKLGKLRTSLNTDLKDYSLNNSQTGVKPTEKTNIKTIHESSESEEEDENQQKQTDDDLTRSLEDLTIDEKV